MMKRLVPALAAVLLAACSGDPAGSTRDGLRAEADGEAAIRVTNVGRQPLYYQIRSAEALASWAPCTSEGNCPVIEPGTAVRIEYAEIQLYQPGTREAELHWWRLARAGDRHTAVPDGGIRVPL